MIKRHGNVDSHGHGRVGRMTSTIIVGGKITIIYGSTLDNERQTETERPEDEKQDRDPDEKWSRGSCDLVSAAFDAFETSKDEAGTGKGHDSLRVALIIRR